MGVVMLFKIVTVAIWAAVAGVTVAEAQTLRGIIDPAEQPPVGFKGQMYVDSKGCVFLRAGYGGTTNWVPRVGSDRKALCGYPPTMASLGKPVPVAEDAPAQVAAAPAPVVIQPVPANRPATGKPMETVASQYRTPAIAPAKPPVRMTLAAPAVKTPAKTVIAPPPSVTVAQAPVRREQGYVSASQAGLTGNQIGCYTSVPVPKLVKLSNGGTAVLCTRGDGSLEGARAPIYRVVAQGVGNRVGAGLYEPAGATVSRGAMTIDALGSSDRATIVTHAAAPEPVRIPKGYRAAWTDDRLNPNRAQGTARGQAQQDQIWTQEVPATLVAEQPVSGGRVVISTKSEVPGKVRVRVSTKSTPTAPVARAPKVVGTYYVQVGTFGVASNAEGAKARLRAQGLQVGTANISKGGKALQIVLAGPFGDQGAAQAALRAARGAGFGDAFIR